jgi:hypothetical protein
LYKADIPYAQNMQQMYEGLTMSNAMLITYLWCSDSINLQELIFS